MISNLFNNGLDPYDTKEEEPPNLIMDLYTDLINKKINFQMDDYCKIVDNISNVKDKRKYEILEDLLYDYINNLSDLELVELFSNYKPYVNIINYGKYSRLNLIVQKYYVESMKYVLAFQNYNMLNLLVNHPNRNRVIDLIKETGVTNFNIDYRINDVRLIDFYISIGYQFDIVYQFATLAIFKYFMTQVEYDIRTVDQNGVNIYMYHFNNVEIFKYIHQTYGHLLDLNHQTNDGRTLNSYINNADLWLYLIKHDYDYSQCDFNHLSYFGSLTQEDLVRHMLNYPLSYTNIISLLKLKYYLTKDLILALTDRLDFLDIKDFNDIMFTPFNITINDKDIFVVKTLYPYVKNFDLSKLNPKVLNDYYDVLVNDFDVYKEEINRLL